ncbi:recombinase family protein [Clostridium sp. D53t1_180928_C8]|uniref:recombinase family protein n=1 Tax=Clostridium sp. D53t1_180928_C8 TaxID=2787101 RepID=UPI0018AB642D|nr:recombinase family protein [Clostridium sp. D53t1_180928_C8]
MNKEFYYLRVSSKDQNIQRQLHALKEKDIYIEERNIFIDKQSGKNFEREQYQLLKRLLRDGDALYIKSIDRFGRNYQEILSEWRELTSMGVDIIVLDMPLLDTRNNKDLLGTLISDLVLQLLSYVASSELKNIKSRQAEGIKSALANGVKFGRPKQNIVFDSTFKNLYDDWKSKKITTKFFREYLNLKPNTFYRRIAEFEAKK